MTRRIAIIGYPLKHSISPRFQQAALDFYKLDVRYEAWERAPSQLAEAVDHLRLPDCLGANVTIPHKEAMLSLVDETDEKARRIGAINTVVKDPVKLTGYNTDAPGFLQALGAEKFDIRGKRALLLGAGGVARAVVYALVDGGAASLVLLNRTPERAHALASAVREDASLSGQTVAVSVSPWEERLQGNLLNTCQLIVNCTSIGMKHSPDEGRSPLDGALIPKGALVFDLVYNPVDTPLLVAAKRAGAKTLGGLAMLVYQGALSFELWTGKKAPLDVIFKAAREALNG